ncbi:CAP domain-containing protein [Streptomyces sp. NPDC001373]|uniref:CAP domain-containing protein n=1 Tax=Streptomyces sp. NPDC001373 TaxID=3364565 RepID=UPI00368C3204
MKPKPFTKAAALLCGLVMMGSTPAAFALTPAAVAKSAVCPTTDPPPGTGSQVGAADADALVRAHNDARLAAVQKYNPGLAPTSVTWSPKLACDAQAWADDPASSQGGGLHHSSRATNGNEGENLLNSSPGPARPMLAMDPSVSYSWMAEKTAFDTDKNAVVDSSNYKVWGHYSQIVWMSPQSPTTQIGCGVKEGVPVGGGTGWILVCRYAAAGNIQGQRAIPSGSPVPPVPPPPAPTQPFRGTSAVVQHNGHLDVFWVGPDGSVRSQWWDGGGAGGAWAAHSSFNIAAPGSAVVSSAITAVSQRDGHLDVFWIGPDGSVRSQWWDGGSASGAWAAHSSFNIASPGAAALGSGIAAVSQHNGHLDVFWTGPDGSVRSQWWDGGGAGGAWAAHGSFNIAPPGIAAQGSAVAAVSQQDGHLDVFWVGPDGSVRSQWWDGGGAGGAWAAHGAFNIASPGAAALGSGIAAVSQHNGHLDVFWTGPDGSVRSQWWDGGGAGGAWAAHGSFNIAPPGIAAQGSAVAAVSQQNGHLDVFWVGPDGSVRSQWWDGGGASGAWAAHGAFNIASPGAAAVSSGIAAVSQHNGHLDVFWIGSDGSVRSQWWDGGGAGGAWAGHGSFNIAPPNSAAPQ